MNTVLKDPRWPDRNRNVHSGGMNLLLGLPLKAKLPAEGMPEREVQGVVLWVAPLVADRKTVRGHRVRARCPHCAKEMSAGRLFQHVCN